MAHKAKGDFDEAIAGWDSLGDGYSNVGLQARVAEVKAAKRSRYWCSISIVPSADDSLDSVHYSGRQL